MLVHRIEVGCVSLLECQMEKAVIFLTWYFVKMVMTVEKVCFGLCCFLGCSNIVLIKVSFGYKLEISSATVLGF